MRRPIFFQAAQSALMFATLSLPSSLFAQTSTTVPMPAVDRSGVRPVLRVDGTPYLMLGAQINNSSAWKQSMPQVWEALDLMHANTLEAPVYWETFEPQEGHFDFSQVDMLLQESRQHHRRLVLLWFGTWKNGSPGYAPEWIKKNQARFPLTQKEKGGTVFSLSPFAGDTLKADTAAFSALMQYLKEHDPSHTVIMVQVENETGIWGAMRDHSAAAEKLFHAPVPQDVLLSMGKQGQHGDWKSVFGEDADEYFSAWGIARYVEAVASAGKRIYPIPMYVNAALRDPIHPGGPGSFESGGPTFDVLPLWHAVAPSLDGIGPDIYLPEYDKYQAVLKQYATPWNAFFVPETGNSTIYAHYFFSSLGHGAFGWSPFGMDTTGYVNYPLGAAKIDRDTLAPFTLNYQIAAPMAAELAGWVQQGRVYGVAESPTVHTETISFRPEGDIPSPWRATVSYGLPSFYSDKPAPGNPHPEGEALIVALSKDEFLVTGIKCRVDFAPLETDSTGQRMWLRIEEGSFQNGTWISSRLWNGDQTDYGLNFGDQPQVLRVHLARYE